MYNITTFLLFFLSFHNFFILFLYIRYDCNIEFHRAVQVTWKCDGSSNFLLELDLFSINKFFYTRKKMYYHNNIVMPIAYLLIIFWTFMLSFIYLIVIYLIAFKYLLLSNNIRNIFIITFLTKIQFASNKTFLFQQNMKCTTFVFFFCEYRAY